VSNRPKIILIFPYRFRKFDTERFEIECLKSNCDVVVYELLDMLHPHFKAAYHTYDESNYIKRFSSILEWRKEYIKLIKSSKSKSYVINFVSTSTFKELAVNYILSSSNVFLVKFNNSGVPSYQATDSLFSRILTKLIFILKRATFRSLKFSIISLFCRYLANLFLRKIDYNLVIKKEKHKNINSEIEINSFDYSMFIAKNNSFNGNNQTKSIVYLDTGAPLFKTDSFLYGNKHPLTVGEWYPKLIEFFDLIEKKTSKNVIVAAHPKHHYSSDKKHYFGNRQIFHGKTQELIAASELVLVTNSTAVSYAVMYSKPVIVLMSDELLEDNNILLKEAKNLSEILGSVMININHVDGSLIDSLSINKFKYQEYKSKYLSSRKDKKTNCEIIIDEIINDL
jgi:hypothetical protein